MLARSVVRKEGKEGGEGERPILRMVFMGMGKPFDNYDNVMKVRTGGEGGREEREGGERGTRTESPKKEVRGCALRQVQRAN